MEAETVNVRLVNGQHKDTRPEGKQIAIIGMEGELDEAIIRFGKKGFSFENQVVIHLGEENSSLILESEQCGRIVVSPINGKLNGIPGEKIGWSIRQVTAGHPDRVSTTDLMTDLISLVEDLGQYMESEKRLGNGGSKYNVKLTGALEGFVAALQADC